MTSFLHGRQSVTLHPGGWWAAEPSAESYRDTAAENLAAIIREMEGGVPWRDAVAAKYADRNPWLYQIVTSEARDLFFRQFPPPAGARIMDVGAGWGQISLPLARSNTQGVVTVLEPTPERLAFIRAAALQEGVNGRMNFIQADFLHLEFTPEFDLLCCVGVLEWVPKFHAGEPRAVQLEFLRRLRLALRPGGRCYLGIENRLGLKYLLGGRDDHTGQRNVSVFDAALAAAKHRAVTNEELRVFTYTHAEYLKLFGEAGFQQVETHCAFPDYKLPQIILPFDRPEALNNFLLGTAIPPEHDGAEGQILINPEEYFSHYRTLAEMGVAHYFSPSFFFILQ